MTLFAVIENPGARHQSWARGTIPTDLVDDLMGKTVFWTLGDHLCMRGKTRDRFTELWVYGDWHPGLNGGPLKVFADNTNPVWQAWTEGSNPAWEGVSGLLGLSGHIDKLAGLFPALFHKASGNLIVRATQAEIGPNCSKALQHFIFTGHRGGWHIRVHVYITRDSAIIRYTGVAWYSDPTDPVLVREIGPVEIRFPALRDASLSFEELPGASALPFECDALLDGNGFPFSGALDFNAPESRSQPGTLGTLTVRFHVGDPACRAESSVWNERVPAGAKLETPDPLVIVEPSAWGGQNEPFVTYNRFDYIRDPSYGQYHYSGGVGDRPVFEFPGSELFNPNAPRAWRALRYGVWGEVCRPIWRTEPDGTFVKAKNHPNWRTYSQVTWGWGSDWLGKAQWGDGGAAYWNRIVWSGHDWAHRCTHHVALYFLMTGCELTEDVAERMTEIKLANLDNYWNGNRAEGRQFKHVDDLVEMLPHRELELKAHAVHWATQHKLQFLDNWQIRGVDPTKECIPTIADQGYTNSSLPNWQGHSWAPWQSVVCFAGPWQLTLRWGWDWLPAGYVDHMVQCLRTVLREGFFENPLYPGQWWGCYAIAYTGDFIVPADSSPPDPNKAVWDSNGPRDVTAIFLPMVRDLIANGFMTLTPAEQTKFDSIMAWYLTRHDATTIRHVGALL